MIKFLESKPKEFLKTVIRDFLGGRIMFSAQVPARDVPLVFLPLAMGGLAYDVPEPELPPEPSKPVKPVRPVQGAPDVSAVQADLEAGLKASKASLKDIKFKARWGEASDDDVAQAKVILDTAKAAISDSGKAALAVVEEAHRVALAAYLQELLAYRAVAAQYRADLRAWRASSAAMDATIAAWQVGKDQYHQYLQDNLGVFYANMADALPRGINGYPMFTAMAMLNKTDWDLVRTAIDREKARDIDL